MALPPRQLRFSGNFGLVKVSGDGLTVEKVATKDFDVAANELLILKFLSKLRHPNIVELVTLPGILNTWSTFHLEYAGPSIENYTHMSVKQIMYVAKDCLAGLTHLNGCKIVHCDIKPANICCKGPKYVIIDFGFACYEGSSASGGTPHYKSPERIREFAGNLLGHRTSDVWSLGVTLFILMTGRVPWGEYKVSRRTTYVNRKEFFEQTEKQIKSRLTDMLPSDVPMFFIHLLCGMLDSDPDKRTEASDVLHTLLEEDEKEKEKKKEKAKVKTEEKAKVEAEEPAPKWKCKKRCEDKPTKPTKPAPPLPKRKHKK
jgi:serine/threonine protein kinase